MQSNLSRPTPGVDPAQPYSSFVDPAGLGVRTIGCDTFSGELLEVLRLTSDLGQPSVVDALVRERCRMFGTDAVSGLAAVMRVETTFDGRLEVWSRLADGFRLSAVLEWAEAQGVNPSLESALTVGDRLLAALDSLQRVDNTSGASGHGAIAIDQIVVSEEGQVTLTDYAFATALAALQLPRERLWRRFRIAMPPAAGMARFDHRVDVTQAAVVICSLLAGRVFQGDEYPRGLDGLIEEAIRRSCADSPRDERDRLGMWLRSATELEPRSAFPSAASARYALREAFGSRMNDTAAVRRWLLSARGVVDSPPAAPLASAVRVPAAPTVPVQDLPDAPIASGSQDPPRSGLRRWMWPR